MESHNISLISMFLVLFLLFLLFFLLFSGIVPGRRVFWVLMPGGIVFISLICFIIDPWYTQLIRTDLKSGVSGKILVGVSTGVILYGMFYLGNEIIRLIVPRSSSYVESVYTLRSGWSETVLALLLATIIGPGEECVWRGFLQRHIVYRFKPGYAIVASIFFYTAAHIPSMNPMLIP